MDRRKFIRNVTAAGTAGMGLAGAATAKETQSVRYKVTGFSCITCAVGLETMLRRETGVTRATAAYPEGRVMIGFDGKMTTERKLRDVIAACGFKVS